VCAAEVLANVIDNRLSRAHSERKQVIRQSHSDLLLRGSRSQQVDKNPDFLVHFSPIPGTPREPLP